MRKNLFIAFEGIDGSGKSTQVKLLSERLEKAGHKIYATCEPTDGPIGKMIRSIFKHTMEADHRTIAALFAADRLEHLLDKNNGLLKKLEEGYTIITDRYYFSSYAYHSVHTEMDWVIETNRLSAGLLRPDLNIFIDISPETGMQRIAAGRNSVELYETLENLQNVKAKYLEAMERLTREEKIFVTNGERAPEQIAEEVWVAVSNLSAKKM
jgi:dTMP kinase